MYRSYFIEFHSEHKFFDSNQRSWDSIYTVSDRFGPDNYRCITRCGRMIISKSDILTVLWLYSAFIRTFLTLIWLFNNSVSKSQYVHEEFFIPDCVENVNPYGRIWPIFLFRVELGDVWFVESGRCGPSLGLREYFLAGISGNSWI